MDIAVPQYGHTSRGDGHFGLLTKNGFDPSTKQGPTCAPELAKKNIEGITGGPAPFAKADRSRFLQALDAALVRIG
jgi:hypothetical protein